MELCQSEFRYPLRAHLHSVTSEHPDCPPREFQLRCVLLKVTIFALRWTSCAGAAQDAVYTSPLSFNCSENRNSWPSTCSFCAVQVLLPWHVQELTSGNLCSLKLHKLQSYPCPRPPTHTHPHTPSSEIKVVLLSCVQFSTVDTAGRTIMFSIPDEDRGLYFGSVDRQEERLHQHMRAASFHLLAPYNSLLWGA